jgi:hypothetical protein
MVLSNTDNVSLGENRSWKEIMILESTAVDLAAFAERTGWEIKPEGACKGDVCVPLGVAVRTDGSTTAGSIDAAVLAERLGMALVADVEHGVYALGPESSPTGRALTTALAPDILLPDLSGNMFRLADLRGKKVVVVSWASW